MLNSFWGIIFFFQCRFSTWLSEKEDSVSKIHTSDFKDQNEMLTGLQKLAVCIVLAYSSFFLILSSILTLYFHLFILSNLKPNVHCSCLSQSIKLYNIVIFLN